MCIRDSAVSRVYRTVGSRDWPLCMASILEAQIELRRAYEYLEELAQDCLS